MFICTYHQDGEVGEVVELAHIPALLIVLEGAALVRPRCQTPSVAKVPEHTARMTHVARACQSLRHRKEELTMKPEASKCARG